jgi:molecular chaperone GrpE
MMEEQKQSATNQENLSDSKVEEQNNSDSEVIEVVVDNQESNLEPETTEETAVPAQTEIDQENAEIISVLQQENAHLKKLLDEKTAQSNGFKAQYARLAADFDNFRKRNAKEKENLERQTKKTVITNLLPVVDNFERARVQIKPANDGEKNIHNSYQGVYKTLVDCLKKLGVAAMRPEGQEFDPNFHEAMLREPTNEHPEGTVIEQLMRGYVLGEEVLRHAMVKVAVPSEPVITSEETDSSEENTLDNTELAN